MQARNAADFMAGHSICQGLQAALPKLQCQKTRHSSELVLGNLWEARGEDVLLTFSWQRAPGHYLKDDKATSYEVRLFLMMMAA